ncbi:MAG TPA: response regulator [Polyangiaceae bacterium]
MTEILVVDDDDDTREALAELLHDSGYRTSTAKSGHEALTRLGLSHPDLLLIDLVMPDMDGRDLLREIQRTAEFERLPAIVMTAWPRPIELPEGVLLLRKPFDWESLFRLVRKLCAKDTARVGSRRDQVEPIALPALP